MPQLPMPRNTLDERSQATRSAYAEARGRIGDADWAQLELPQLGAERGEIGRGHVGAVLEVNHDRRVEVKRRRHRDALPKAIENRRKRLIFRRL